MSQYSSRSSQTSPYDQLILLVVGLAAIPVVVGAVFSIATWNRALDWLTSQHILASAADSPLLRIPGGHGVGLDGSRLAIAGALVVFLVALTVSAVHKWNTSRKEQDQ